MLTAIGTFLVFSLIVSGIVGLWAYKRYKDYEDVPIQEIPTTNLFDDLNDLNLLARKNMSGDSLQKLELIIDDVSTLYDKLLSVDTSNMILGPKSQIERLVNAHLLPYVTKFIHAEHADEAVFVEGLNKILEDVKNTLEIVESNRLNEFEMNHQFINIKY